MTEPGGHVPFKRTLGRAAGLFLGAYLIALPLWLLAERPYGYLVTGTAARVAAAMKGVAVIGIDDTGDGWTTRFLKNGLRADLEMEYRVITSRYAFNTPLTLAIMAAFFPFLRKRRVYAEVTVLLVAVHFLAVFALLGEELTSQMVFSHFEAASPTDILWDFSGDFFDNLVVRFEPFLVGAYLYFRRSETTRRPADAKGSSGKRQA